MTASLVDSNVLLDLLSEDQLWAEWSQDALATAFAEGPVVINPIIYSEVSTRFSCVEELNERLPDDRYVRTPLPWSAAFLAGKAFSEYRKRGGLKRSPLPDFYIGAHAAVAKFRLLTRDSKRYRTYFPMVELIAP